MALWCIGVLSRTFVIESEKASKQTDYYCLGNVIRMKMLPIGISTFSEMIKKKFYYVDKSRYVHHLNNAGKSAIPDQTVFISSFALLNQLQSILEQNGIIKT